MLDCTKRLVDLTPYEAYQCFLQADIWQQIGKNTRRMWAAFTGTTIGDWGAIIFAFALVPAQLASYILPFIFCGVVMKRYGGAKHAFIFDSGEQRRKKLLGRVPPLERSYPCRTLLERPLHAHTRQLGDRVRRGDILAWPLLVGQGTEEERGVTLTTINIARQRTAMSRRARRRWRRSRSHGGGKCRS